MKVLILGLGLQGKAVIHDLEQSASVSQITAADIDVDKSEAYVSNKGYRKVRVVPFDASQPEKLKRLIRETGPDVLVCMLPADFQPVIARTAIDESVSYVSSSYAGTLTELNDLAVEKGVTVLPEMGLDPGVDLFSAGCAWMNWTRCTECVPMERGSRTRRAPPITRFTIKFRGPSKASSRRICVRRVF